MRLRSVVPVAVRLPLTRPIKMAGASVANAENLLVRVEDEEGIVGWGEAASAPTMTGETAAGMLAAVEFMRPQLEEADIGDPDGFAATLDQLIYGNPAAKSAVDMALYDLSARRRGVPLVELLGGAVRDRIAVLWMLAVGERDADVADARQKAGEGFAAFKVKVGLKGPDGRVERDLERACAVRAAVGAGPCISADANQGYSREEGVGFSRGARNAGLDFIEQPVRGDDLEGMRAVAAAGEVPIGADEGIHSVADLERHHALNAAQGGSLKILKLGGLRAVMKAGQRAEALGMNINLAGKIAESSIASAANVQLAAALPQLNWDISLTHQYLAEDVVKNPVRVLGGHVSPLDGPGLGIEVDEERVRRFAYRP